MGTDKSITARDFDSAKIKARLCFLNGRNAGDEVKITKDTFFIGRSQTNNLILEDRSVSRKHAVLNFLDGEFVLSDLNSYKGIELNGEKVKEVVLRDGDKIRFGVWPSNFCWAIPNPVLNSAAGILSGISF